MVGSSCSAYLYWVGVQGGDTNSKMVRISGGTVNPSKRLWAFANWSRFVRPGAVRVGTSGAPSGVRVSAFKNVNGAIAVQFLTGAAAAKVSVKVTGGSADFTAVKGWLTDNTHDVAELDGTTISAGVASANVPARAMVTLVLTSQANATAS